MSLARQQGGAARSAAEHVSCWLKAGAIAIAPRTPTFNIEDMVSLMNGLCACVRKSFANVRKRRAFRPVLGCYAVASIRSPRHLATLGNEFGVTKINVRYSELVQK